MNYKNSFSLKNKNVYIFGGAGFIGKEIVDALSSYNAHVIILDINKKEGIDIKKTLTLKKRKISFKNFDITKKNINKLNLKKIFSKYGSPDIMINTSYPKLKSWSKSSFKKIEYDTMNLNVQKNLITYSWLPKVFADFMVQKKIKGSIISMGSIYGLVAQNLNFYKNTNMSENMFYPLIKGALISHTKQLASFYGQYGIRVNLISPGGLKGHVAGQSSKQNPIFVKNYIKNVPLNRMCQASDIANACIFLSSDSSKYITGVNLVVDGGITSTL